MSVGLEQPTSRIKSFTTALVNKAKDIGLVSDPQTGSCLPQLKIAHKAGHTERQEFHLDQLARESNSRGRSLFFESRKATQATRSKDKDELPELEAHSLIHSIIKDGDEPSASYAKKSYALYLAETNVMGTALNAHGEEIASPEQRALNALMNYVNAESESEKRTHLETVVEATGFLYFEKGADNLTTRRIGEDNRLSGFYQGLKNDPSTRVVYDLIHDDSSCDFIADCKAIKESARAQDGMPAARPDPLLENVDVIQSLVDVNIKNTKTSRITGNANLSDAKAGTNVRPGIYGSLKDIQTRDPEELAFLQSLGLGIIKDTDTSYNFNFNKVNRAIYDFTGSQLNENEFGRKDIVNHFVASYFLLLRREKVADGLVAKRKLALKNNTDPTQTKNLKDAIKAAGRSKTQAQANLKKLEQTMNNPNCVDHDGEVIGTVKELLEQRKASVLLMVATNLHRIEIEACDSHAQGVITRANEAWGQMAQVGSPAHTIQNFEDLVALRKESVDNYQSLSRTIADEICTHLAPDQKFLNTAEIEKFQILIETHWKPSQTSPVYQYNAATASANATAQHDEILAATLAGENPSYFDAQEASKDFRAFVTAAAADATNPNQSTYQYIIDNWDKVFKDDFASLEFTKDEVTLQKPGYSRERCIERLFDNIQRPTEDQGSVLEKQLRSDQYKARMGRILDLSPTKLTAGEKVIRQVVDNMRDEEIAGKALPREGEAESTISQLLRGKNLKINGHELVPHGINESTRLAACTKIAQTIANSGLSPLEKDTALDIIGIQLLGANPDTFNRADFVARLNAASPITGNRTLTDGIAANRTAPIQDFATLEQHHYMANQISSNGIEVTKADILSQRKPDLQKFIQCAYGHNADAADQLIETIEALATANAEEGTIDRMHDLANEISNTAWGTEAHEEAVTEYYDSLRTLGINPEFDLGQYLTRDDYEQEIPLFDTSFIRSAQSSDFFQEILELLKSLLKDFTSK
jgi:hypothetical protein